MPSVLANLEAYYAYLEQDPGCNQKAMTYVRSQIQNLRRTSSTKSGCTEPGATDESVDLGSPSGRMRSRCCSARLPVSISTG